MPDFAIVDTHVHLYDPRVLSYPWMKQAPALGRPYLADDFRRLTAGVDVEAIVFVEVDAAPGDRLAEARFAQDQRRSNRGCEEWLRHCRSRRAERSNRSSSSTRNCRSLAVFGG